MRERELSESLAQVQREREQYVQQLVSELARVSMMYIKHDCAITKSPTATQPLIRTIIINSSSVVVPSVECHVSFTPYPGPTSLAVPIRHVSIHDRTRRLLLLHCLFSTGTTTTTRSIPCTSSSERELMQYHRSCAQFDASKMLMSRYDIHKLG